MCSEFFTLFGTLIKLYQKRVTAKPELIGDSQISIRDLLQETYTRLKSHESTESESDSKPDSKLVGLLVLVKELLECLCMSAGYDEMITFTERNEMLHEFFFENLYYMPGVTKSATKNKCKSNNSRTQAYKLLNRLTTALRPKEMAEFLENYLWRMIEPLSKPKSWYHDPVSTSRSKEHKYAGIKNLGNICYMISMLQ